MHRFNADVDYYGQLGLKNNASQAEIKTNFYDLAKKHHPDALQGKPSASQEDQFKKITAAYDILSDDNLKKDYDAARYPHQQQKNQQKQQTSGANHRGADGAGFNYNY